MDQYRTGTYCNVKSMCFYYERKAREDTDAGGGGGGRAWFPRRRGLRFAITTSRRRVRAGPGVLSIGMLGRARQVWAEEGAGVADQMQKQA